MSATEFTQLPIPKRILDLSVYAKKDEVDMRDFAGIGTDNDDTAKFNQAVAEALVAGAETILIPNAARAKVYNVSEIVVYTDLAKWRSLVFRGTTSPVKRFGTIGGNTEPLPDLGCVIKSFKTTPGAIIRVAQNINENNYIGFTPIHLGVENLTLRSTNNPFVSGIDAANAYQLTARNLQIDTARYSAQASSPTHNTAGITTPKENNAALTILDDVAISGYAHGIICYEHTSASNLNLTGNLNGLTMRGSGGQHSAYFGRVAAQRNQRAVNVENPSRFDIAQLNIEHAGVNQVDSNTFWQLPQWDLFDPNGGGRGSIRYTTTRGDVGILDEFFASPGALMKVRDIREDIDFSTVITCSFPYDIPPNSGDYGVALNTIAKGSATEIYQNKVKLPASGRYRVKYTHVFAPNSVGSRSISLWKYTAATGVSERIDQKNHRPCDSGETIFSCEGRTSGNSNDSVYATVSHSASAALPVTNSNTRINSNFELEKI